MFWKKWIPWQLLARKAAKTYGFTDPLDTLDRIRRFSRPSEASEPIELLRAGFAFHARGLANTKAIQNNLDWVWPYWIQRQYNPNDISFVPRAFSFSHINLTQRNWTAVGVPDSDQYGIIDPRGLITPFHDSWSIDFWILSREGISLIPCQMDHVEQTFELSQYLTVRTIASDPQASLATEARMERDAEGAQLLEVSIGATAITDAELVISIRPYNPEGVQFIDRLRIDREHPSITVNDSITVYLPVETKRYALSNYDHGDVIHELHEELKSDRIECAAGMATAAAMIPLSAGTPFRGTLTIPIPTPHRTATRPGSGGADWKAYLANSTRVSVPDARIQRQYDQAKHTLALLSPLDAFPGPYTYKRFWFRDACLIAHALLKTGQFPAARRALEQFPHRQTRDGYFLSQEGEWDSNGQVLWIYAVYERLTGDPLPDACFDTIRSAVRWIERKLIRAPGERHHGLFPAGFSAEHFGPNDHYYWDDFWAVGGLRDISKLLERHGANDLAREARMLSNRILLSFEDSLQSHPSRRVLGAMPASPYRRLDSGAIGSLVSDYPLQIWDAGESRVLKTADYLFENCVFEGAFFQDMIHSGLNIYLTLDLAQTFLRAGDPRWRSLYRRCLDLASPTGQWPEAVHPRTLGGCMGDGQHGWAAAEWAILTIHLILREETGQLIVGSGVLPEWLENGQTIELRDAPTSFGKASVRITTSGSTATAEVTLEAKGEDAPTIVYRIPGYEETEGSNLRTATLQRIPQGAAAR